MKRLLFIMLILTLLLSATGCGTKTEMKVEDNSKIVSSTASKTDAGIDVDLTTLGSTMVYAEVYNMLTTPDKYLGKSVKMSGKFSVYHDDASGKDYLACIINDATACCSQGIEFVRKGNFKYPDDYPELGTLITVSGVFGTYSEGNNIYCQLTDADMLIQ